MTQEDLDKLKKGYDILNKIEELKSILEKLPNYKHIILSRIIIGKVNSDYNDLIVKGSLKFQEKYNQFLKDYKNDLIEQLFELEKLFKEL